MRGQQNGAQANTHTNIQTYTIALSILCCGCGRCLRKGFQVQVIHGSRKPQTWVQRSHSSCMIRQMAGYWLLTAPRRCTHGCMKRNPAHLRGCFDSSKTLMSSFIQFNPSIAGLAIDATYAAVVQAEKWHLYTVALNVYMFVPRMLIEWLTNHENLISHEIGSHLASDDDDDGSDERSKRE